MSVDFFSLAIIVFVSAVVPLVARLIPKGLIPETVFLLVIGAILGPHVTGLISVDNTITFMSDLGLSFLFLLAGYEINLKNLVGHQGRLGLCTWVVSFLVAVIVILVTNVFTFDNIEGFAISIVLTTTALGTLLPILQERGLMGTRIGDAILAYGTWGELCPVLAMAVLLSTRVKIESVAILFGLILICVLVVIFTRAVRRISCSFFDWVVDDGHSTSQTYMRFTILLLVLLLAFSELFELDIVLGAFAAGFVLSFLVPEDNTTLLDKLQAIAHGFFIPLFFIVSGANINPASILSNPAILLGFIGMLLLIRALPVFLALTLDPASRDMAVGSRLSVALYCTTALPVIVAVTSVAVSAGTMSDELASVLVSAGAITVLVMPLLACALPAFADTQPLEAVREMVKTKKITGVVHDHIALGKVVRRLERDETPIGFRMQTSKTYRPVRTSQNDFHVHDDETRESLKQWASADGAKRVDWVTEQAARARDRLHRDYSRAVTSSADDDEQDDAADNVDD